MDRTLTRLNFEHYHKLLAQEMDEPKWQIILRLLAEEEAESALLTNTPPESKSKPDRS
jgi:hypothetical protein